MLAFCFMRLVGNGCRKTVPQTTSRVVPVVARFFSVRIWRTVRRKSKSFSVSLPLDVSRSRFFLTARSSPEGPPPRLRSEGVILFDPLDRRAGIDEGGDAIRLEDQKALVTGGSRGLGLGLVEALAVAGAEVTVVARGNADLAAVRERLGVATIAADVTDADAARAILAEARPDVLALIAGALPPMRPLHEVSWPEFAEVWDTDVKAGLYWMRAALKTPLVPGSRILVGSSGAALNGSPLSGGYAGAKRMLWIMAEYANGVSKEVDLGLQFQVLVPRQMVGGTGVGGAVQKPTPSEWA